MQNIKLTADQIAKIAAILQQGNVTSTTPAAPKSIAEKRREWRSASNQALREGTANVRGNVPVVRENKFDVSNDPRLGGKYSNEELDWINQPGRGGSSLKTMPHSARVLFGAACGLRIYFSKQVRIERTNETIWMECDDDEALDVTPAEFMAAIEGRIIEYQKAAYVGGQVFTAHEMNQGQKVSYTIGSGATFSVAEFKIAEQNLGARRFFVTSSIDHIVLGGVRPESGKPYRVTSYLLDKNPDLFQVAEHGMSDLRWVFAHIRVNELGGGNTHVHAQMLNKNVGGMQDTDVKDPRHLAFFKDLESYREYRAERRNGNTRNVDGQQQPQISTDDVMAAIQQIIGEGNVAVAETPVAPARGRRNGGSRKSELVASKKGSDSDPFGEIDL